MIPHDTSFNLPYTFTKKQRGLFRYRFCLRDQALLSWPSLLSKIKNLTLLSRSLHCFQNFESFSFLFHDTQSLSFLAKKHLVSSSTVIISTVKRSGPLMLTPFGPGKSGLSLFFPKKTIFESLPLFTTYGSRQGRW
jgi:hypothetical protein